MEKQTAATQTLLNTFKNYCRRRYGGPVGKIALDAGLVCPNRRKGGCIYCAAQSFTPYYLSRLDPIPVQVAKGRDFLRKKGFARYLAYFQQETTTAVPAAELLPKLATAIAEPDCVGLIISTRPDYLEQALLAQIKGLVAGQGKDLFIELGLQSAHDVTLAFLNRNHSFADFADAVRRVRGTGGIELGVHLILGLPGETYDEMLTTVQRVSSLGIDYIKFHHLQVIRGTRLHDIYEQQPFAVYNPEQYLLDLARLLAHVPERVVIHRLWSTADPHLLVQPQWDLSSSRLHDLLVAIMDREGLYQGKDSLP